MPRIIPALIAACAGTLMLGACAGPYTGPVEVTRFVAQNSATLGQGPIRVELTDGVTNDLARSSYVNAVSQELARLGYTIVPAGTASTGTQVATIRTSRQPIAAGPPGGGRSPVTVGVGGGGGGFGGGGFGGGGFGGVGGGIGINLGGGQRGPNVTTELAVRIDNAAGVSLWEGRSQIATAIKSPYSQPALSARTLASGLFREFPGGNGQTVTIKAQDLQPPK